MKGARRIILAFLTMVALAATALAPPLTAFASTTGATTLADPITMGTWKDWGLESSTQNVGRIWTDKSVSTTDIELTGAGGTTRIPKGDSDFLTAFSALSSTSNQRETATTPLDVVLVLDASGSMSDPIGGGDSTTRIKALKDAAGSFIDELAARNATISDASQRHAVSIVKFSGNKTDAGGNSTYEGPGGTYNYSQVMAELTTVDAAGAETLKGKVDAIRPAGATQADNGVALAKEQLTSHGHAEARKVVVFFTDGKPTSFSDFSSDVANAAVSTAKTMKDSGVTIYAIGIQSGANPSDTRDDTNAFLNALSSNYPSATAYRELGTRADKANYYKSATNAAELSPSSTASPRRSPAPPATPPRSARAWRTPPAT